MDQLYIPGETTDWQETVLWKQLEQSKDVEANSVRTTLNECMPQIQKVLAQGQTAASDFTLHDSGHAFRVARRMAEVVPADVLLKLSTYELALLLLSAYLHDIGMTPERRKVTLHHRYLLTGDPQDLSQSERDEFQKWLDNEGRGIVPPLSQERSTIETLRLAEELITYYCRHRHNDWCEEWIREHLTRYHFGTYVDWIDDLVELCRSHHYGYHELVKDRFNPKVVGTPASIVHLRYLGCILRVADILEFDPERTPDVILRHRNISPGSLIYWWKDHYISMVQEGNRLVMSARPPRAYIHRAIEITADQVDEELRLCRTLADETHFEKCPGLTEDLPHRWTLLPALHRDISEKEEAYEYINGAFRPDTDKLLELLSGIELYGTPLAAVRELLQNAFDAVREQVAYERLARSDPKDPEVEEILSKLHRVELRLETSADGVWLVCTDTGVGMTKAIITDHLLVSGAARRHDILDLARRCSEAGFELGRTGQFGIGVLSYFMLADRLTIRTRRGQEAGDTEPTGWCFETEGVGSFGELRRENNLPRGTEVRLHIRPKLIEALLTDWFLELREYLTWSLLRIPCKFQFNSSLSDTNSLTLGAGWVLGNEELSEALLKSIEEGEEGDDEIALELASNALRQKREAEMRKWKEISYEAKQCLNWRVREVQLPAGLGRVRMHLPYFELPDGASLVFLRIRKQEHELFLERMGQTYGYNPQLRELMGWKGMRVQVSRSGLFRTAARRSAVVEIDWSSASAGKLSVNRGEFSLDDRARQAISWVEQQISEMYRSFLQENEDSTYAALNCRVSDGELNSRNPLNWFSMEHERDYLKATWRPLRFPAINGVGVAFLPKGKEAFEWNGEQAFVIPQLAVSNLQWKGSFENLCWNSPLLPPDRVVARDDYFGTRVAAFWECEPKQTPAHPVGLTCSFPPEWHNVVGAQVSYDIHSADTDLWNSHHPIVRAIDAAGWEWALQSFMETLDPLPLKGDLLKHKSRAAAWVIHCFQAGANDLWDGLKDRDPSFLNDLWVLLFSLRSETATKLPIPICRIRENGAELDVLSSDGWSSYGEGTFDDKKHIRQYLPDPSSHWYLRQVPVDSSSVKNKHSKASRQKKSKGLQGKSTR